MDAWCIISMQRDSNRNHWREEEEEQIPWHSNTCLLGTYLVGKYLDFLIMHMLRPHK